MSIEENWRGRRSARPGGGRLAPEGRAPRFSAQLSWAGNSDRPFSGVLVSSFLARRAGLEGARRIWT